MSTSPQPVVNQGLPPGFSEAPKVSMPSDTEIRQMAVEKGLNPDIISKQVKQESKGNPDAVSTKGAIGPMQLMPHTAQALGVDPHDPVANLRGGMTLMQQLLTRYDGDYEKALAAYNAGPVAVDKHGGVPPYPETQHYVSSILGGSGSTETAKFATTGLPAGFTSGMGEAPTPVSQPKAATPDAAQDTGVLAALKRNTVGVIQGIYHAYADDATPAELQHFKDLSKHYGVPEIVPTAKMLASYRLFEEPGEQLSKKADAEILQGQQAAASGSVAKGTGIVLGGAADKVLANVPMLGPFINSIAERAEKGDVSGAATDIAMSWAAEHAPSIIKQGASSAVKAWDVAHAANLVDQSVKDITAAIPPSKSAPYSPADERMARVHLENEQRTTSPITSVEGYRDAADTAISKIEDHVSDRIAQAPDDVLKANPLNDVKSALSKNPRGEPFAAAGLKELEDFKLGDEKTVGEADDIRRQLNAENKAVLKKNNYDVATARAVDPGFAAREVAAESIRHGLYDALEARGTQGLGALRGEEGSLIKMRNAAEAQIFKGNGVVASYSIPSLPRRIAGRIAQGGGAGLGASVGGVPGAIVGSEIGGEVANAINGKMTRDALIKRSFEAQRSDFLGYPKGRVQALPTELPRPTIESAGPLFNQQVETGENLPGTRPQHVTEGAPTPRPPTIESAGPLFNRQVETGENLPGTRPQHVTEGAPTPTEPVGTQLPLRPQPPGPPSAYSEPAQRSLFNEPITLKSISERLRKPFVKNPEAGTLNVGGKEPPNLREGNYVIEQNGDVHSGYSHEAVIDKLENEKEFSNLSSKAEKNLSEGKESEDFYEHPLVEEYLRRNNAARISLDDKNNLYVQTYNALSESQRSKIAKLYNTYAKNSDILYDFSGIKGDHTISGEAKTLGEFLRAHDQTFGSKEPPNKFGMSKFKTGQPVEFDAYHSNELPEVTSNSTGGTFFHDKPSGVEEYGEFTSKARLNFKNPLVITDKLEALTKLLGSKQDAIKKMNSIDDNPTGFKDAEIARLAKKAGHDGIIYTDVGEESPTNKEFVALGPKSFSISGKAIRTSPEGTGLGADPPYRKQAIAESFARQNIPSPTGSNEGGGPISQEAINRPGVAYKVGPSGVTYLGKDIDAVLKPGEAVIRRLPDGSLQVHNTNGLTDKAALSRYGGKVTKAMLKGNK